MKTKIVYIAFAAFLLAHTSFAADVLVGSHIRYIGNPAFCWRNTSVMSTTNIVQGIVDYDVDGIFLPPTTNTATSFVAVGDTLSTNAATPPAIGYDGNILYPTNLAQGHVLGFIEAPCTGFVSKALYRAFSALTITQAAYYADGSIATASYPPPAQTNFSIAIVVSNINPAYSMMAHTSTAVYYGTTVTGSVNTVAGGANNQFANSEVMVYYRTNAATAWTALSSFSVSGNGAFIGTFAGTCYQVMVGRPASANTLPNSLRGQGPVTPVAGPSGDISEFAINLSNDYKSITLSWNSGAADIWASTNDYYIKNAGWYLLQTSASTPWLHDQSTLSYSSIFYRVILGTTTSAYDVGKITISIPGGNGFSFIASPFADFTPTTSNIFLNQLSAGSQTTADQILGTPVRGGALSLIARYRTGTPNYWQAVLPMATNMTIYDGLVVRSANVKDIAFAGKVSTNSCYNLGDLAGGQSFSYFNAPFAGSQPVANLISNQLTAGTQTTADQYLWQPVFGGAVATGARYRSGTPNYWQILSGWTNTIPGRCFYIRSANAVNNMNIYSGQ